MKRKFELYPYIRDSQIGEVEVTVELTEEEYLLAKTLEQDDFREFILSKAECRVTDFECTYDTPSLDEWNEINDD